MGSSGATGTRFKRGLPLYLFFLAVSPFLLSLIAHGIALFLSSRLTWSFSESSGKEEVPRAILLAGRRDDGLAFQGTDPLDAFRADDRMAYPLPELDYRPVLPEVDHYPDPRLSETTDIISIEAAALDSTWVNPSTGRQPLHTGPERLAGSFSRHIQVLREGGLDVVFVFDATASMSSFLRIVKLKIERLALAFKKLVPACRIGLVAYRDVDAEAEFVTRTHPLTYAIAPLRAFLLGIEAKGGGDREEAVDAALRVAVTEMAWHDTAKKFILLIGDAPPHGEDLPQAVEWVRRFREEMGGTVAALDTRVPKYEKIEYEKTLQPEFLRDVSSEGFSYTADGRTVMDAFRVLAEAGGGESARLRDEQKVVRNMLLLIFGARWEMYLEAFMTGL